MRLLLGMMVGAVALAGVVGACGNSEEEVVQQAATLTPSPDTSASPAPSTPPAPSPTPAATPEDTFTYTDPTYGYSFDYPSTWYVSTEGLGNGSVTLYSYDPAQAKGIGGVPPDKLKAVFWVAEGVDKPLEEWLAEGDNSPGQISPPSVLAQSETMLGARQGLVRTIEIDGEKYISYYVPLGAGRVFVVNGGSPDSQVWPQFLPVLASLRLPE